MARRVQVKAETFNVLYIGAFGEDAFAAAPMALERYLRDNAGQTVLSQHDIT